MATLELYPLNDFIAQVTLKDVDATGAEIPVTTGTVTAFLATSNGPTATAADPTLSVSAVYTGAGGVWLITIDAAVLTASLLALHFATVTPYLIVQKTGAVRVYAKCKYKAERAAA